MSATQSRSRSKQKPRPSGNGASANGDTPLAQAIAYEEAIAQEAKKLRGAKKELTPELYMQLWPLLRKPIPAGFIVTTPETKGKPYDSTGIKSLQVLVDRMNGVLTPLWWWYEAEYLGEGEDHGKLAEVTVYVGERYVEGGPHVLTQASSRGGVNQASTIGNRFKGSETNAAKRAFAQIGPGHEVYLGAVDLDPDVNPDAAKAQEESQQQPRDEKLKPERAEKIAAIVAEAGIDEKHVKAKLRGFGAKEIGDLTVEQGMALWEWIQEQSKGGDA